MRRRGTFIGRLLALAIILSLASGLTVAQELSGDSRDNLETQAGIPESINVTGNNFEGEWLDPEDPVVLRLNRLPDPNEGELRVIMNNSDLSSLLHLNDEGDLVLQTDIVSLPRGLNDIALYLVTPRGEWQELTQMTLQVRSIGGFETSEVNPRVDLANKGQLAEGHSKDAGKPDRRTYQDLAIQAGIDSTHTRGELEIRTSLNLVGSTVQEEALRFDEKGEDAPKFDLSDYLIELQRGKASFSVGHINYGNNMLLIDNVGNRGLKARYRFNDFFDVSLSTMNGTSIVGYSNIFGLNTLDHNISAATVGVELLRSRPGGLRMELTYMDASIESQFNFDVGEVPDAETNRGAALRLIGSSPSGRLRGDFSIARSRYRNPDDPFLSQGNELVKVEATTDIARRLELSYDILQNLQLTDRLSTSLSISYLHDKADPLYKSAGAFVQPDWQADQFTLSGQVGQVNLQVQYLQGEDNVDRVPTILKTKTRSTTANIDVPMQSLVGESLSASPWWPSVYYTYERVHQFAANNPDSADSGFNGGSHLPDQENTTNGIGVQWYVNRWGFDYRLAVTDQDNRQTGRKTADFKILTHDINLTVEATDDIDLGLLFSYGKNADQAQDIDFKTRSRGVNADWRITTRWMFNGSYITTKQDDSGDLAINTSTSANAQLSWSFSIPAGGRRLPGQVFARYTLEENNIDDRLFDFQSNVRNWMVNSGVSLSLF